MGGFSSDLSCIHYRIAWKKNIILLHNLCCLEPEENIQKLMAIGLSGSPAGKPDALCVDSKNGTILYIQRHT